MAKTCPFSETSRCRDETEALDLRDRDETKTLKNSISRLSRDRDMSRETTALLRTLPFTHSKPKRESNPSAVVGRRMY